MNAKKLIIFDYDGTMSDTSPGIMHCYNTAAGELGLPPHTRREDFVGVIGGPLEKGFRSEERRVGKECRSRWSPYH